MANPRQRRKQRSGTKTVRSSRRQQDRLKKVDPRGPASFVAAWDKTKTPRQNWKALGLLSGKLDPRASGGAEHTLTKEEYWAIKQGKMADFELPDEASDEEMDTAADAAATEDPEEEDEEEDEGEDSAPQASTSTAPTTVSSALGKGEGRIIRDASGKVIQIILGGDDSATEQTVTASTGLPKLEDKGKAKDVTPWGAPMEELDNIKDRSIEDAGPAKRKTDERLAAPQGIAYAAKRSLVEPKTALVVELEKLASGRKSAPARHASARERSWLEQLVDRHSDDFAAMARDRSLNTYQRTEGELRRAVKRAGGLDKLRG